MGVAERTRIKPVIVSLLVLFLMLPNISPSAEGGTECSITCELMHAIEARESVVELEWEGEKFLSQDDFRGPLEEALEGDLYLQASVESVAMELHFDGRRSRLVARFKYRLTDEEQAFVEKWARQALEGILHEGASHAGKVKAIHDHVISILSYDASGKNDNAYRALMTGEATCQGYALLFYEMLRQTELSQQLVAGNDHMWNRVLIDGEWYHVDCTYDDLPHEISYKYFLKTDAEMKSFGRTWSFSDKASISFR